MVDHAFKEGDILSYTTDRVERLRVISIKQMISGEKSYEVKCLWNGSHFSIGDVLNIPCKAIDERFQLLDRKKTLITKTRKITRR